MQKVIHYFYDDVDIWRKGKAHSVFRICYTSWLRHCPNYGMKLWHPEMPEFQQMLKDSRFLRECYERKMWAFVSDYVRFAKESGILVGPGRGSAAGSLVSYLLNITTIDPIKYNLLFERFLNPERVTMPDIDIDFEYTRREEVVDYCISKYGSKMVAPIITFGTLGAKQSIRDVGRCLNIPNKTIDRLCSFIDSKLDLRKNYEVNSKLRNLLDTDNLLKKLYNVYF